MSDRPTLAPEVLARLEAAAQADHADELLLEQPAFYAVVEIKGHDGHHTRAGIVSEVELAGVPFLRILHPTALDHTGVQSLIEFYAAWAVFSIRPCSPVAAAAHAAVCWRGPDLMACRVCGCTTTNACPGGCSWALDPEGLGPLCSACLSTVQAAAPEPSAADG